MFLSWFITCVIVIFNNYVNLFNFERLECFSINIKIIEDICIIWFSDFGYFNINDN